MVAAEWTVRLFLAYWATGLVFAVAFASFGIQRVDPVAKGSGAAFRLLIMPGAAVLWPVLLQKWIAAKRSAR